MKFKLIFILFNVLMIFSFIMIIILPLFVFGSEYSLVFMKNNWYIGLFFALVIAGLNVYFAKNWKLFTHLEREDWPGLIEYLERDIYTRDKYGKRSVKLLINAYLLNSKIEEITKLRLKLEEDKPKLAEKFILQFGVPCLARNDPAEISNFFGKYLYLKDKQGPWINWCYCFGLILQKKIEEGVNSLSASLSETTDPIIRMLSIYLLDSITSEEDLNKQRIVEEKSKFSRKYTRNVMEKEMEKQKSNILVAVLAKIITQALGWIFASGENKGEKIS